MLDRLCIKPQCQPAVTASLDVVDGVDQSIDADRAVEDFLAHLVAVARLADQFQIAAGQDHQMIDRTERVITARRDGESQAFEQRLRGINVVVGVDDQMIKGCLRLIGGGGRLS